MKKVRLEKVIEKLENMTDEVLLDDEIREKANAPLVRMLELAGK